MLDDLYPDWSNRSRNEILTIDRKKYLKCVKCGETKLLTEFYSYFYYTKTQKKKKYKNSCKECHKKVVMDKRNSDDKYRKLHNIYNKNHNIRRLNKDESEDKSEYLGYIWQKFGDTHAEIHKKRNKKMETLQRRQKRQALVSKRKRKEKLVKIRDKRAQQKLIVDALT